MTKNAKLKAVPDLVDPFSFLSEEQNAAIADWQKQGWTIKKDDSNFWAASKNFGHENDLELEGYSSLEGLFFDLAKTDEANAAIAEAATDVKDTYYGFDEMSICECGQPAAAHNQNHPHSCDITGCEGFYRFISSDVIENQPEEIDGGFVGEVGEIVEEKPELSENDFHTNLDDFSEVAAQRKLDEEHMAALDDRSEEFLDRIFAIQAVGKILPKDARIYEHVPVNLTPREKTAFNNSLVQKLNQTAELKRAFKAVQTRHKSEVEELETETGRILKISTNGYEYRDVECFERYDYEKGVVRIIRKDTYGLVRTREMTTKERQQSFF